MRIEIRETHVLEQPPAVWTARLQAPARPRHSCIPASHQSTVSGTSNLYLLKHEVGPLHASMGPVANQGSVHAAVPGMIRSGEAHR